MISTTAKALEFYSQIAKEPTLLAKGYELISSFLRQSQENRRDTLLNLLDAHVPVFNLVVNVYPQEIFSSADIDDPQKESTVAFLLDLIVNQLVKKEHFSQKHVDMLFDFMIKIHNAEGFEKFVQLYKNSMERLALQNVDKLGYFLVRSMKHADDRVSILAQDILAPLLNIQFFSKEEQLQIYYYILKSLSFKTETDPDLIEKYVEPHIKVIYSFTIANMKISIRAMQMSLKIIALMLGDYEQECTSEVIGEIEMSSDLILKQYIKYLNSPKSMEESEDEEEDEPMQGTLYQMMEICSILLTNKQKIDCGRIVYFCIVCTFMPSRQYKNYIRYSDQYLMDVEDEGEINIRNKAIFLLNQAIDIHKKKVKEILKAYTTIVINNPSSIHEKIHSFLEQHKFPQELLRTKAIYIESALFLTTSFTRQLFGGKVMELTTSLGEIIKISPPEEVDPILAILILNRSLKNQATEMKQFYLNFMREAIVKYRNNIGMLIAIARGIYEYCPLDQLVLSNDGDKGVPALLVELLNKYLLKDDSAQEQSAYLVLQFYVHLLKCEQNVEIMRNLIPFQDQVQYIKLYISKGMSSVVIMEFTEKQANPLTLEAIYKEVANGFVRDENLATIIGKSIRGKTVVLNEGQITSLCKKYERNLDFINSIVAAFLQTVNVENPELIRFLSQNLKQEWLPGLLKQGKLLSMEQKLIQAVTQINEELESLDLLQNALLLPYFAILNNPQAAISLLNSQNIFVAFFEKVYRYAKLFKGVHLKIMTSHIFMTLAERVPDLKAKVIELVRSYGNIESSDWEDDDIEAEDMDDNDNYEKYGGILDKIFERVINDRVEEAFKNVFGEVAWDSQKMYSRLALLEQ